MTSTEFENQPVQEGVQNEEMESPVEGVAPTHKSLVNRSKNPLEVPNRFNIGDTVHMPVRENGTLRRGVFTVRDLRLNEEEGYWGYRLREGKVSYNNGEYVRENKLKAN